MERARGHPLVIDARRSWTHPHPLPVGEDRPPWRTPFFLRPARDRAVWPVHHLARVDGLTGRVDLDVVRPSRLVG
ncbi:hypothetical protein [Friedmanniella luteola]|uniref:hypothetical protein n=1 Tax=Friedmanniella luteola TaxID=546871 RepID=UPI000B88433D|nr:hypothetical protein [Friedmanniella luteola]